MISSGNERLAILKNLRADRIGAEEGGYSDVATMDDLIYSEPQPAQ